MRGRIGALALLLVGACRGDRASMAADGGRRPATAADGGAARATAIEQPLLSECEAALATLTRVIPEGVVGDSVDMKFCMAMPRPVVKCLVEVKTEDEADRCMAGFVGSVPPLVSAKQQAASDEPRAGKEECRRAIENVRTLVPAMTGDTDEMVEQCAGTEPTSYVKCLIAAKSIEELDTCDLRNE
jgi:hypothetical protein